MGGAGRGSHQKEDKELIDSLNSQVAKLKTSNAALNSKVEQLTEAFEKKKRELNLLKKTAYLGKGRPSSATAHNHKSVDENNMELEVLNFVMKIFKQRLMHFYKISQIHIDRKSTNKHSQN